MATIIKTLITTAIVGMIAVSIIALNNYVNEVRLEKVSCAKYKSWQFVQRLYEENKEELQRLDRDGDGIACEALKQKQ